MNLKQLHGFRLLSMTYFFSKQLKINIDKKSTKQEKDKQTNEVLKRLNYYIMIDLIMIYLTYGKISFDMLLHHFIAICAQSYIISIKRTETFARQFYVFVESLTVCTCLKTFGVSKGLVSRLQVLTILFIRIPEFLYLRKEIDQGSENNIMRNFIYGLNNSIILLDLYWLKQILKL